MKAERAREIAEEARKMVAPDFAMIYCIEWAIRKACKEQREADASLCAALSMKHHRTYKIEPGPNAYNPYFEGASDGAEECEQAIRSAE